mgnify:CR=1 FL=1
MPEREEVELPEEEVDEPAEDVDLPPVPGDEDDGLVGVGV